MVVTSVSGSPGVDGASDPPLSSTVPVPTLPSCILHPQPVLRDPIPVSTRNPCSVSPSKNYVYRGFPQTQKSSFYPLNLSFRPPKVSRRLPPAAVP